ncbi:MAG: HesB/IscA family protein [bacterium]
MIQLSEQAAQQIKSSAKQGDMPGFALRVAVKKNESGAFEYAMGFDDNITEEDTVIESQGVQLLVSSLSEMLVSGTTIDFVELDDGQPGFVFLNPNDPAYSQE